MGETAALRLARWARGLAWEQVPPAVQETARLGLLDTLGLILLAADTPPGQAIRSVARRQGGHQESSVFGSSERFPASLAALVHGTVAHAYDFDDTFPTSVLHPGSLVVPVALAVGEAVGASGAAVMAAIAAGYELGARMGGVAGRHLHARGFQSSSVFGPLVAAAVAGKLYGLDELTTAQAMGLAGSMSGGLLEFLTDGSWSKRLHPGWAAHGGILAAQLAASGFPGPPSILEGPHGIYQAFMGREKVDHDGALAGLDESWQCLEVAWKFYPCAHVIHPFLDAAMAYLQAHGLPPNEIEAIECDVPPWIVPIACEPRAPRIAPPSENLARASLPWALAGAFTDGRVDVDTFSPAAIERSDLRTLAARVTYRESPELAGGFAGRLHLVIRGQARQTLPVPEAVESGPRRVEAKFRATAGRAVDAGRVAELLDVVHRLDTLELSQLIRLLGEGR